MGRPRSVVVGQPDLSRNRHGDGDVFQNGYANARRRQNSTKKLSKTGEAAEMLAGITRSAPRITCRRAAGAVTKRRRRINARTKVATHSHPRVAPRGISHHAAGMIRESMKVCVPRTKPLASPHFQLENALILPCETDVPA